jgi:uncharacterized protein
MQIKMKNSIPDFQIFIKPAGPSCNLSCTYCYYLQNKNLYPGTDNLLMTDEVLKKYIVQHIQASEGDIINFSWHGGEPLLAGIDFYRKAIRLQNSLKPSHSIILNGIQTNGTLLNKEWCRFFDSEGFNVGMSIDGPGEMHNRHRRSRSSETTLPKVINGFNLLKKHGVIPEILCVVNADNVKYPLVIYNYFKDLGAKYISFLPLVEPDPGSSTAASRNSVPAEEFGLFLSAVFDEWVGKDIGEIKIQIFEEAARTAFGQEHTLCLFKKICGRVPVVEYTGDFYCCDHFVDSEHLLGNINDHSLTFFLNSEKQKAFGEIKSCTLPGFCTRCEVRSMCNGECPKNRFITSPDGEPGLNYLCSGYKYFFNHCRPFVEAISKAWKNQKSEKNIS